jgi:hypothetical protein
MSGAAIKGLAYSSKLYAAGQKLPITLKLVSDVKNDIAEDLANIDKYAKAAKESSMGFGNKRSNGAIEELSWERILGDGSL